MQIIKIISVLNFFFKLKHWNEIIFATSFLYRDSKNALENTIKKLKKVVFKK